MLQEINCEPILINAVEDHIHILCNCSRTITIANLIETVKTSPSSWIKNKGPKYHDFFWQSGYGAFSVSQSNVPKLCKYISDQQEHHRTISFQGEFRILCRKHHIDIDEKYVWD